MLTGFELPWYVFLGYLLLGFIQVVGIYIVGYWLVVFMTDVTKTETIVAKVWPFGEWDVGYKKKGEKLDTNRFMPSRKEDAVTLYFKYEKSEIIEDCWIEKVGGFLDGIRIKPKPRTGRKT